MTYVKTPWRAHRDGTDALASRRDTRAPIPRLHWHRDDRSVGRAVIEADRVVTLGARQIRFEIAPRPPFRLDLTAWALRRRAHNVLDDWDGTTYRRAVPLGQDGVELAVRQVAPKQSPRLEVTVTGPSVTPAVVLPAAEAVDRFLGTSVDLDHWYKIAAASRETATLADRFRGLKPPRLSNAYEALITAIFCQQITLDFGIAIVNAWTERYGQRLRGAKRGAWLTPAPSALAALEASDLRPLRISRQKAQAAIEASRRVTEHTLDLEGLQSLRDEAAVASLTALHGVGRWTAEYVLLRGLGRLHVFPINDAGARNSLSRLLRAEHTMSYAEVAEAVSRWHPYAGMLYFHLLIDGLERSGRLTA